MKSSGKYVIATVTVAGCMLVLSCCPVSLKSLAIRLDDPEDVMVRKMESVGAKDVTKLTRYEGIRAISGEQKYYWWELPDQTIVGVLMHGYPGKKKLLLEAEVGVPDGGLAEIEHWSDWRESKKLKTLYPDGTFRLKISQPP